MQGGRESDARALMDEVNKMPEMHDMYGVGFDPHLATEATFAALYPIEMHDWATAAALTPLDVPGTASDSFGYWAKAIGSAHLHQTEEVRKDVAAIETIHQKFVSEKKKDFAEATENDLKQAQAWLAFSAGKYDDAVAILRPMAEKEESLGDEPQGIPSREMIAEILLEAKRPQQALIEYQADLKFSPNRFNGLYGAARAAETAGKQNEANDYYATLLKICDGGSSTRPELSHARDLLAKK
jgi:tetratricopeptide (TPR) repeat protein